MDALEKVRRTRRLAAALENLASTKLNAPVVGSRMVERTHLLDKLRRNGGVLLITISDHTISGKTTLLCQWVTRERPRAAWYCLDKSDNDGAIFLRRLFKSLSMADGALCRIWRTLIDSDVTIVSALHILEARSAVDKRPHCAIQQGLGGQS